MRLRLSLIFRIEVFRLTSGAMTSERTSEGFTFHQETDDIARFQALCRDDPSAIERLIAVSRSAALPQHLRYVIAPRVGA